MKKLLILTLLFTACAKEQQQVLIPGTKHHLRGDVFNDGAYQPEQPLTLIDLYEANGTPYAHCRARVDWTKFALKGVADQTIAANNLHAKQYGDTTTLTWAVPQWDLR